MTDLRTAANMALHALEFNLPVIENFGNKEQLTDCHRAIMALYKSLAQHEQDWSLLKATQESLREHQARIKELEAQLAKPDVSLTNEGKTEQEPVARFNWNEAKLKEKNT